MGAFPQVVAALDDPNLIATVHYYGFWSGETVSYTLTKSGSTVTGAAG